MLEKGRDDAEQQLKERVEEGRQDGERQFKEQVKVKHK